MEIDRPDVVAEVAAAFAGYEDALVAGDVEAMLAYFRDAPDVVRFGIADAQVGLAEQRAWRLAQPPLPPGRTLTGTRVTAFGADVAVVTTRFGYGDAPAAGRQSQTWVRLPEGWRIVTAHVSVRERSGDEHDLAVGVPLGQLPVGVPDPVQRVGGGDR